MPKFKAGDHIVPIDAPIQYDRIVIGTTSHGHVVYEYFHDNGDIMVGSARENKMKLKPVKKEGWMAIRSHVFFAGGRNSTLIYDTEKQAKEKAAHYDDVVAVVKVEWEE